MQVNMDHQRQSGMPQYLVVAETIQGWITSGRYKSGDAIATVNDLAEQFSVSRGTIQEALRELSIRGIIVTARGKRSTVRQAPQLRPVFGGMDLGDPLFVDSIGEDKGKVLSIKTVSPDRELREQFDFGTSEVLTEYRSIIYLNDRPNGFVIGHVPSDTTSSARELTPDNLRKLVRQMSDATVDQERRVSALPADFEIATHLEIPVGTPVLRYRCIFWHNPRQLDLYYEVYLRTDDCEYRLDA